MRLGKLMIRQNSINFKAKPSGSLVQQVAFSAPAWIGNGMRECTRPFSLLIL